MAVDWLPEPGETLDERYKLGEQIGVGPTGAVYSATRLSDGMDAIVKVFHPELFGGQVRGPNTMRLQRARLMRAAGLVTLEEIDVREGSAFVVMPRIESPTLLAWLAERGAPGEEVARQIVDDVGATLEVIHQLGVHGDIKPSNIFLTERGKSCDVAQLLDFGLVQSITQSPITLRGVSTKIFGSPSYMCPEQAVGMRPDSRGDLYSLGAVAYFLLTGRPPFTDEDPIMLIVAHATVEVPTFQEIGATVPEDLANVILRCLSRNPAERFHSAREVREALESCECANDWGWRAAEDWWNRHRPRDVRDNQASPQSRPSDDTSQIASDPSPTASNQEPRINHEEPTLILKRPSELEAVVL